MSFEEIMEENCIDFEIRKNDSLSAPKVCVYDNDELKVSFLLNNYRKGDAQLVIDEFRVENKGSNMCFNVFNIFYSMLTENNIPTLLFRYFKGKNFPFKTIKHEYIYTNFLRQFYNFKHDALIYTLPNAENVSKKRTVGFSLGKIEGVEHLRIDDRKGFIIAQFTTLNETFSKYLFNLKFEEGTHTGRLDEGTLSGNYLRQTLHSHLFNPKICLSTVEAEADSFKDLSFKDLEELVRTQTGLEE